MNAAGGIALDTLKRGGDGRAAQELLERILAAVGPLSLDVMIEYLHCSPAILLGGVGLLKMIATLLPNLSRRIIQTVSDVIDDVRSARSGSVSLEAVLEALAVFPLDGESSWRGEANRSDMDRSPAVRQGTGTRSLEPRRGQEQGSGYERLVSGHQSVHRNPHNGAKSHIQGDATASRRWWVKT